LPLRHLPTAVKLPRFSDRGGSKRKTAQGGGRFVRFVQAGRRRPGQPQANCLAFRGVVARAPLIHSPRSCWRRGPSPRVRLFRSVTIDLRGSAAGKRGVWHLRSARTQNVAQFAAAGGAVCNPWLGPPPRTEFRFEGRRTPMPSRLPGHRPSFAQMWLAMFIAPRMKRQRQWGPA